MRISDWSSDVCSSDLGEDRVDQRAHATPPFVYACTAPASPSRADRDEPATGQRTRPYGFAPDIGCSRRVNRTCRTAPDLMRHFVANRSEEHTSELQSLMRISYAVFCLKKKTNNHKYRIQKRTNKAKDNR